MSNHTLLYNSISLCLLLVGYNSSSGIHNNYSQHIFVIFYLYVCLFFYSYLLWKFNCMYSGFQLTVGQKRLEHCGFYQLHILNFLLSTYLISPTWNPFQLKKKKKKTKIITNKQTNPTPTAVLRQKAQKQLSLSELSESQGLVLMNKCINYGICSSGK